MASRKCPPDRDRWTSHQRHSPCSEGLSHNHITSRFARAAVDPGLELESAPDDLAAVGVTMHPPGVGELLDQPQAPTTLSLRR